MIGSADGKLLSLATPGAMSRIGHVAVADTLAFGERLAATAHHDRVSKRRDEVVTLFDDLEILVAVVVAHFVEQLVIMSGDREFSAEHHLAPSAGSTELVLVP
jgi:hypothetical protein